MHKILIRFLTDGHPTIIMTIRDGQSFLTSYSHCGVRFYPEPILNLKTY